MTIDKRLVQITVDAYCAHQSADGSLNKAIEEALEAYEAAKWSSIKYAPENGTVMICLVDCRSERYTATRANQSDWHFDTFDDELVLSQQDLIERGAMFKVIEPGPQK